MFRPRVGLTRFRAPSLRVKVCREFIVSLHPLSSKAKHALFVRASAAARTFLPGWRGPSLRVVGIDVKRAKSCHGVAISDQRHRGEDR